MNTQKQSKPITNKKFGNWTVLSYSHQDSNYQHHWKCRCDCGTEYVKAQTMLINGYTTQCRVCSHAQRRKYKPIESGDRYGKWTVIQFDSEKPKYVFARCACNTIKRVIATSLQYGQSTQCSSCRAREASRTHGHAGRGAQSAEYRAWCNTKTRTLNYNNPGYENSGGRGIKMHPAWLDDFEQFFRDTGPRPTSRHSLDRINNEGHYEPGNVRWALPIDQVHNRRVSFRYNSEYIDLKDLSKRIKAKEATIKRLLHRGLSIQQLEKYGDLDHYGKSLFGIYLRKKPEAPFEKILESVLSTPLKRTKRGPYFSLHRSMIKRCYKKDDKDFQSYGGRGIEVYEPWRSFRQFKTDIIQLIGERPSLKHSLDRINPDGHYIPSNVRWSTASEQARNKRASICQNSQT